MVLHPYYHMPNIISILSHPFYHTHTITSMCIVASILFYQHYDRTHTLQWWGYLVDRQEHRWWSRKGSAVPWSTFHLQPPHSSCLDQHHLYRHQSHPYFLSCLSQIRSVNCLLACNLIDSGVLLIFKFAGFELVSPGFQIHDQYFVWVAFLPVTVCY